MLNVYNQGSYLPYAPLTPEKRRGEVLALRTWNLVRWSEDNSLRLAAVTRQDVWHEPVLHADQRPEPINTSGIYAMKPTFAGRQGFDWLRGTAIWVWGWVGLYGRIIEHQNGYRAEHAIIRRLRLGVGAHLCLRRWEEVETALRELEQRYQCQVNAGLPERHKATRLVGGPKDSLRYPASPRIQVVAPPPPPPPPPPPWSGPPAPYTPPPARPAKPRMRLKREKLLAAFKKAEALSRTGKRRAPDCWRFVTLKGSYSRWLYELDCCSVRHGAWLFPKDVVVRAARILKIKPAVLLNR